MALTELEVREGFSPYYSYNELLDTFGLERVIQVDDGDYQGDTRVLFRDGERYGYLNFGWGSCSGCDALQACSNHEEATKLRDGLFNSIVWKPDALAMLRYFVNRDWPLDYAWHVKETRDFIQKVIKYLAEEL